MPDSTDLDPNLTALAAALAGLTPAAPALDRDRLFYQAGRRAARRRPWGWPLAMGLCAALAFGLGARLAPPPPAAEPQVVYVPVSVPPESAAPSPTVAVDERPTGPAWDERRLRELTLIWAAEAPLAVSVSAPTVREPVESLLGIRPGILNDVQLRRAKTAFSRGDI